MVRRRRVARALGALAILVFVGLAAAGLWFHHRLTESLPVTDGALRVAGLTAAVRIERDSLGTPTVRAANRADAAFATGFVHAQDRFFEMDTLRRRAAGELAELFGKAALADDREVRVHRFRAVAMVAVAGLPADQRALLDSYCRGVNAGLAALAQPPFEYLVLRAVPRPWRPEDSLLTLLAMFVDLQGGGWHRESALALMEDTLPPALADFLAPAGTEWDAPLTGAPAASPAPLGPDVVDLRKVAGAVTPRPGTRADSGPKSEAAPPLTAMAFPALDIAGSNAIAVAGWRAQGSGAGWIGNDLHLGLRVPNLWYRMALSWGSDRRAEAAAPPQVIGMTVPGLPFVVVGSNRRVAWGVTNLEGDTSDLVLVAEDPHAHERYLVPGGSEPFRHDQERIHVRGAADESLDVVATRWGPIVDHDRHGRPRALAWVAQHPDALDLRFHAMETAADVEGALAIANQSGIPALNVLVAGDDGRIAWTVAGRLPRRVGFSGRLPVSWADGSRGWQGWTAPSSTPRVVAPASGLLWSANGREVEGSALAILGDGGYVLGARARQLRDDLLSLRRPGARELLGVLLDDRAVLLDRWRGLLLATLSPSAVVGHADRRELRRLVAESWDGHASPGSAAYRLVRDFRQTVMVQALRPLLAACKQADNGFRFPTQQAEGPLWTLVARRPPHLLAAQYANWDDLLLGAVDHQIAGYRKQGLALAAATWGRANLVEIRHPLSAALPVAGRWLDMPAVEMPGDEDMPRVQKPHFGASLRMVVSPGAEAASLFEMPGGECGNPLSPHYRDEQQAWVAGSPAPFQPGAPRHRLILNPS